MLISQQQPRNRIGWLMLAIGVGWALSVATGLYVQWAVSLHPGSLPGAYAPAWDDPKVKKALPFADELKQAIEQAKSRPVSPVYPQISQAIYKNVNEALTGAVSPEEAIKQGQADMEKALATF